MKAIKKFGSLLIAAVMMMAMTITAFAASGSITINGAQKDGEYKAYKVFDATVSGEGDTTAISYTIPEGSSIATIEGFGDVFETTQNGGKTYVQVKEGVSNDAVINWLKGNEKNIAVGTPAASETNTIGAASITLNVDPGYYFITSSVGSKSAVEVTSAKPNITINDKVETSPSVDPNEGKKVNGKSVNDMQVGDTATFTVTFTATNYATKDGEATAINSYTVTDTPDGFTIDKDTVKVEVNEADYNIEGKTVSSNVDNEGVLTVTIPWDQSTYTSPSTVVVTYKATLTNKNLASGSSNKASVKYSDTKIPGNDPETKTYNYTVSVDKVDASDEAVKLAGAKFVLKNAEGKFYKVDAETGAVSWADTQADATEVTTDSNGVAAFKGLAHGTYTLVETQAPAGYNLAEDSTITLHEITEEITNTSNLTVEFTVKDKRGTVLPSTGGMGTTVFYVLGSLLVICAGVVLIARKRMSAMK